MATHPDGEILELLYEPGVEPIFTPKEVVNILLQQLVIARDRRDVETEERLMMQLDEQYSVDPSSRPPVRE